MGWMTRDELIAEVGRLKAEVDRLQGEAYADRRTGSLEELATVDPENARAEIRRRVRDRLGEPGKPL